MTKSSFDMPSALQGGIAFDGIGYASDIQFPPTMTGPLAYLLTVLKNRQRIF